MVSKLQIQDGEFMIKFVVVEDDKAQQEKIKGVIDIVYVGDNNNLENTFLKIIDTNPVLSVEEEPVFDFLIAYLEKYRRDDKKQVTIFGTLKLLLPTILIMTVVWIIIVW